MDTIRQAGVPAARILRGGVEWVLSLPPRIRYVLAWDHALCRAVVAVYLRAVLGWLRRHARGRGVADGRGGAVAIVPPVSVADAVGAEPAATAYVAADGGRPRNRGWADLMQRSFGFDVLACPRCPGRLTLVALIQEPAVILRILRHLGLPDDMPVMRPARDPPLPFDGDDRPPSDD